MTGNVELEMFERMRRGDDKEEYWSARELQRVLEYSRWEKFEKIIEKAKISFKTSKATRDYDINNHFRQAVQMVEIGSGAERRLPDYQLSRYACYLVAQNADSRKRPVALAQSYFNVQTLRQEQARKLSEDGKRIYIRRRVTDENKRLFDVAKANGVEKYGKFYDAGYKGLYGMGSKDIREKKGLGKDGVLDRAGSTELAANLFRITQTEDKLRKEVEQGKVLGEEGATDTHFDVGRKVRKTIREIGGTMPEELLPEEHVKEVERRLEGERGLERGDS